VAFDFDKLKLKVGPLQKTFTIKDKPIDLQCAVLLVCRPVLPQRSYLSSDSMLQS